MTTAMAKNLKNLEESGFSAEQAEVLLQITRQQTEELLENVKEQVDQTEKKVVTKEYLDLQMAKMGVQIAKMKTSLFVQTVGIVLAGMVLLGWFIDHLDTKSRAYIDARLSAQDALFTEFKDNVFNEFKDNVNIRFDKIESDLKDIKNFIFSRSLAVDGEK